MTDNSGRTINYMRVSVTDRCNLRCKYCMPYGIRPAKHSDILTYEEILRLCRIAVTLGIVRFKITGGEPLVRKDCTGFITRLKAMPGVEQVTMTTNGLLLADHLDELCAAGIDGINISLDTLRNRKYSELTGHTGNAVETVMQTLRQCIKQGIFVKINAVLLTQTFEDIGGIALLAGEMPLDIRFIELMPLGPEQEGVSVKTAFEHLLKLLPGLHPVDEKHGNGPAQYYATRSLRGRIGFIGAMSHQFCESCNRIRLTSTGMLVPCLLYGNDEDIKTFLRNGSSDEDLRRIIQGCIEKKPPSQYPASLKNLKGRRAMCRIGG